MTLHVNLDPELSVRIAKAASDRAVSPETLALKLLEEYVPRLDKRSKAIALLDSWIDSGDEEEQRETGNMLIESLDKHRSSPRPLFPAAMQGITW
jgi:hypothetical protein